MFWSDEVPPSPNDQDQLVGELVEVSVKLTESGAGPVVIFAVNDATGMAGLTVI
jgi:hypothetical protein